MSDAKSFDGRAQSMTPTLVICRGLPASGKSTFAEAIVRPRALEAARVNQDMIRQQIYGASFIDHPVLERRVRAVRNATIEALMVERVRLIVSDDTNLHPEAVSSLVEMAESYGYTVRHMDMFLKVPVELCIRRDLMRERSVGASVIRGMRERYADVFPPELGDEVAAEWEMADASQ